MDSDWERDLVEQLTGGSFLANHHETEPAPTPTLRARARWALQDAAFEVGSRLVAWSERDIHSDCGP